MNNVELLLEKVAAKKPKKSRKGLGQRQSRRDKSGNNTMKVHKAIEKKVDPKGKKPTVQMGASGTKPKVKPKATAKPAAKAKAPTLHEKLDTLTQSVAKANKPKPKPKPKVHKAVKLGLVAAGTAGATHLVNKVRQQRQAEMGES